MLTADNDFIKRQLIQLENTEDGSDFPFRIVNDNPDEKEETCWKFVYIDPAFQDIMCDKKVLEWTKLKLGDVIQRVSVGQIAMVTAIDSFNATNNHIFAGRWLSDSCLTDWEKVED